MSAKRPAVTQSGPWAWPFEHAQVTADTTWKLGPVPRRCKVIAAYYHNVTGLAEDATNVFALSVMNGATVIAGPLSTDSDLSAADASIVADTWTEIPLHATEANHVLEAGDELSFLADEGGAATLPAGRVLVWLMDV